MFSWISEYGSQLIVCDLLQKLSRNKTMQLEVALLDITPFTDFPYLKRGYLRHMYVHTS